MGLYLDGLGIGGIWAYVFFPGFGGSIICQALYCGPLMLGNCLSQNICIAGFRTHMGWEFESVPKSEKKPILGTI